MNELIDCRIDEASDYQVFGRVSSRHSVRDSSACFVMRLSFPGLSRPEMWVSKLVNLATVIPLAYHRELNALGCADGDSPPFHSKTYSSRNWSGENKEGALRQVYMFRSKRSQHDRKSE